MLGLSMPDEQFAQNVEHVLTVQLSLHMDRQAFTGVLIDNGQHAECTSIMRSVHDKVIRPDMVLGRRAKTDARTIIQPKSPSLRLLAGNSKPFTAPYPLNPGQTDVPAFLTE